MTINKYLLAERFQEWKSLVESKDKKTLTSFSSSAFLEEHENYKRKLVETARKILDVGSWTKADIGTGKILEKVIASIEIDTSLDGEKIKNNLVFTSQHSYTNKPHQSLLDAVSAKSTVELETLFFNFYTDQQSDDTSFEQMTALLGKKYPLIAYLFFVKNRRRYVPISPTNFEKGFRELNINIQFSHQCSWENYTLYIHLIEQVRDFLSEELEEHVELIDAHSFIWILTRNIEKAKEAGAFKYEVVLSTFDPQFSIEEQKLLSQTREIPIYTDEDREEDNQVRKFTGDEGEYHVFQYEVQKLKEAGLEDLSHKVERVSKNSDAHGYDIRSFDTQGNPINIEVKTTTSNSSRFTFYLSRHELKTALSLGDSHYLYCIQLRQNSSPLIRITRNPFSQMERILDTIHSETGMNISSQSFKIVVKFA